MSRDRDALLATILASPDDDAPRLVYADWLTENGEGDRGEFVRVQVELAPWAEKPFTTVDELLIDAHKITAERGWWLQARQRELLQTHAREWFTLPGLSACSVWDHPPTIRWFPEGDCRGEDYVVGGDASRGFVGSVECSAPSWLQWGDALSWSPKMTVPCRACAGRGTILQVAGRRKPCKPCSGSGRVPRPCPATAQPITEVRLTTALQVEYRHEGDESFMRLAGDTQWVSSRETARELRAGPAAPDADSVAWWFRDDCLVCRCRWPAVEKWHLPPEPRVRPPIPPDFFGNVPVEEATVEFAFPNPEARP